MRLCSGAPSRRSEEGLIRVIDLTGWVIGWLYFAGGYAGSALFAEATAVDRLVFVPIFQTCPR